MVCVLVGVPTAGVACVAVHLPQCMLPNKMSLCIVGERRVPRARAPGASLSTSLSRRASLSLEQETTTTGLS